MSVTLDTLLAEMTQERRDKIDKIEAEMRKKIEAKKKKAGQ